MSEWSASKWSVYVMCVRMCMCDSGGVACMRVCVRVGGSMWGRSHDRLFLNLVLTCLCAGCGYKAFGIAPSPH